MGFNLAAAQQAGYSDEEIANFLAKPAGFDVGAARQAGYSNQDIIGGISARWQPTEQEVGIAGRGVGVHPLPANAMPVNKLQPLEPDPIATELEAAMQDAAQTQGVDSDEYRQMAAAHAKRTQPMAEENDIVSILNEAIRSSTYLTSVPVSMAGGESKAKDYGGALAQGVIGQGAGTTLSGAGELYGVAARAADRAVSAVLPESVAGAMRSAPLPDYMSPEQILKRPGEALKGVGETASPPEHRQGLDTDIVAGAGQLGFQLAAALASGGASSATSTGMLLSQGADIMAEKTRGDKGTGPVADALGLTPGVARDTSIVAGAGITALTERYGLNLILERVPPAIKNNVIRYLADVSIAGGIEAAQEVAEGILHDLTRRFLNNPDAPVLDNISREALAAGGAGAIARAVINAATGMRMRGPQGQPEPAPQPQAAVSPPPPPATPPAAPAHAVEPAPVQPAQEPVQAPVMTPAAVGAPRRVWTAKGEAIDTQLEVVEADQLIASHDATGNVNPAFQAEMQPRDRSRQASRAQIANIAQNLKPELLGDTGTASDGAPVVGPDGVVESGNARTLGLRQAYGTGKGAAYKQWLVDNAKSFGLDSDQISGLNNPVLVRRRTGQMTPEQRAAFARDANQATVAAMAPAEVAKADAGRITNQDMAHFAPDESGNVLAASNEVFLRQFAKRLGQNEVAGMMTADGRPTKQMADRIQQAVFSKAYQDERLVALQAEEANPEIRNILAGLTQAAPAFARARSIDPELGNLDVVPHLVEAANLIRKARTEGRSVPDLLAQQGLFDSVPRETSALARFMDENRRSGKRMGEAFKTLGETIENTLRGRENGQLFGDDQITMAQVIEVASGRMVKEYGAEQAQGDLLAQPKAEAKAEPAKIPRAKDLTAEERAVESRFADYLANNTDEAIARYQKEFGKIINTDNARELSEDYAASKDSRSRLSAAVHEPASWLTKEIYRRELAKQPTEGEKPVVLFTAGGTGAGKSSAMKEALGDAVNASQIIYDTNLNDIESARNKIDQAIAAGKGVVIAYVHRHPVEALASGSLPRAMRMGRTVPMSAHLSTHKGAAETVQKISEIYDDGSVSIAVIDNTHGKGQARPAGLDIVKTISYNQGLIDQLDATLEEEYSNGRITEVVYEGTKGRKGGVRAQADESVGTQPEQKRAPREQRQSDVEEEGGLELADDGLPGHGTLAANPFGIAIKHTLGLYSKYAQKLVDRFHDKVGYRYDALRNLPDKEKFKTRYYELLGRTVEIDNVQSKLYAAFKNASDTDKVAVYNYLTTANASPGDIQDADVRSSAVAAKRLIDRIGERLVHENLLSRATVDKHRGEYLPRVYLKRLLGESSVKALGGGLVPSDMGYLKQRKDIPEDVRRLILGEIKDPGYLASRGFGVPARDVAMLDFFRDIASNKNWIYPNVVTEWGGKPVSVFWLKAEAERLQKQIEYMPANDQAQAEQLVRQMRGIYEPIIEELGKTPDNYKQIPDTAKYGGMRGLWVRSEIYNLILGGRNITVDNDAMQKVINGLTWYNQIWKSLKVVYNPPAQIRNHVGNGVLAHLSGIPFAMVPMRYVQAIRSISTNGKHWRVAKRYGVQAAGMNQQELIRIERDTLDLLSREKGRFSLATLKNMAGIVNNAVGDAYQFSESLWKTAKIIDAMERESKSPAEAAKAAHDAIFDYSMVPQFVKKARTMPVGIPFMTFYYKALPMLLRTAVVTPWRYAPYVAIPYILAEIIKEQWDVDDDDLKALQKALPQWLEEKGTAYFLPIKDAHGRWQAMDFGYFMPWGNFQALGNAFTGAATEGAMGRTANVLQAMGIFGGPLTNIITAIQSNRDPFTNREIANKNDPPEKQIADMMLYAWRLNAPTWVTDIGVAGHMYRAVTGKVNPRLGPQYGEQMGTVGQAALRGVGVNIYPIDPEKTRAENMRNMAFDIKNVAQRLKQQIRDPNLTDEQKANMIAEYRELIDERRETLRKYEEASKINPRLLQDKPPPKRGDSEYGL